MQKLLYSYDGRGGLPTDLWKLILMHLSPPTVYSFRLINKHFYNVIKTFFFRALVLLKRSKLLTFGDCGFCITKTGQVVQREYRSLAFIGLRVFTPTFGTLFTNQLPVPANLPSILFAGRKSVRQPLQQSASYVCVETKEEYLLLLQWYEPQSLSETVSILFVTIPLNNLCAASFELVKICIPPQNMICVSQRTATDQHTGDVFQLTATFDPVPKGKLLLHHRSWTTKKFLVDAVSLPLPSYRNPRPYYGRASSIRIWGAIAKNELLYIGIRSAFRGKRGQQYRIFIAVYDQRRYCLLRHFSIPRVQNERDVAKMKYCVTFAVDRNGHILVLHKHGGFRVLSSIDGTVLATIQLPTIQAEEIFVDQEENIHIKDRRVKKWFKIRATTAEAEIAKTIAVVNSDLI